MRNCNGDIMKIALLGDLHIGVKNDDKWIEDNIYQSLKWFTDECKSNGVTHCIQAGDFFDVRKGISQRTLNFVREKIVPLFNSTFEQTYVLVGNHDLHFKNEITPNSCTEVLGHVDKFTVVEKPTTVNIGGSNIDIIPWMCKSNQTEILEFIKNSYSDYCVSHWELNGFFYYKGVKSHGLEPDFLDKYKSVWSGHFHTISNSGNVQYLGTPYTITLGDAGDSRGYWLHDTDDSSTTFCPNPITYHYKAYFDADTWKYSVNDLKKLFTDKVVKLIIEKSHSETNKIKIDKVLDDFEQICHEFYFQYNEAVSGQSDDDSTDSTEIKKTFDIITEQIDILEEATEVKDRIKKIFNGLYVEASREE